MMITRVTMLCFALVLGAGTAQSVLGADDSLQMTLNVSKAAPRSVETLTQRALLRDYKFAWTNLAQALQTNSAAPVSGLFVGSANRWLRDAVSSQRRSGLSSRYSNQITKSKPCFMRPRVMSSSCTTSLSTTIESSTEQSCP